jgi:signal transduction histidine kinase
VSRLDERSLLHLFVGAFVAVALAFVGASVGTLVALRDIRTASQDLIGNALPSVSELMRARTAQRRLDVDVAVMVKTQGTRDQLLEELDAARAALMTSLNAAMETPDYPGERELFSREVTPRLSQLDRSIDDLRAAALAEPRDEHGVLGALAMMDGAAQELDAALQSLAELNHAKAFEAAWRITNTHAHAVRVSLYLEALSALAAAAAATLAVRMGRRVGGEARRNLDFERGRANELDVLAQRVAHDLVSPLAAASLSLRSVEQAHSDPETRHAVDRIKRALERSGQMVQAIYAFSCSGAAPAHGAATPLRSTFVLAAEEALGREDPPCPVIDVETPDEIEVAMDSGLLGVVARNLLSNALKFSRDAPVRKVTVRWSANAQRVRVEVEDTGPGVPAGLEQTIFEPYRRAPGVTQPGLGLGLATVRRLVQAHRGEVGVGRARSGGAIFWFELPRASVAPATESGRRRPPAVGGIAEAH